MLTAILPHRQNAMNHQTTFERSSYRLSSCKLKSTKLYRDGRGIPWILKCVREHEGGCCLSTTTSSKQTQVTIDPIRRGTSLSPKLVERTKACLVLLISPSGKRHYSRKATKSHLSHRDGIATCITLCITFPDTRGALWKPVNLKPGEKKRRRSYPCDGGKCMHDRPRGWE